MAGKSSYDRFLVEALDKTFERMTLLPMNEVLKAVLLGNVLSAFIYNANTTFEYIKHNSIEQGVFEELMLNDKNLCHPYLRKLYLIGLGAVMTSDNISPVF